MDRYTLAHASGADWKSTAEQCLAEIKRPEQRTGYAQIGLLYLTDNIAADTEDILAFLREQTGVRDWVGSVGMGICATGQEYFDEPAIAILITEVEENSYRLLEGTKNLKPLSEEISVWSSQQESCFAIVHADPRNGAIPDIISGLADQLNGFLVAMAACPAWCWPEMYPSPQRSAKAACQSDCATRLQLVTKMY